MHVAHGNQFLARNALCDKMHELRKLPHDHNTHRTVGSLRSKRFRRAFRPLEAFFAFWLRKNWGERNTDGSSGEGEGSEECIERAECLTETLATQAIPWSKFNSLDADSHRNWLLKFLPPSENDCCIDVFRKAEVVLW